MNIVNTEKKQVLGFKNSRLNTGMFSSSSDEWETPLYVFDILKKEFNFQIDVCATPENTKCKEYFTKEVDGLTQEWSPYRCWMNPPYGKNIKQWMRKAFNESKKGALVVCLIPARTDTKWWHEFAMKSAEIRFIEGRLCFGNGKQSAPFPSCVVIFYPEFDNPYKLSVPVIKSVYFDKKIYLLNR